MPNITVNQQNVLYFICTAAVQCDLTTIFYHFKDFLVQFPDPPKESMIDFCTPLFSSC